MADKQTALNDVVDALLDLSRITLAVSGKFSSKSDAVRKLSELSIPPSRVAAILAMPLRDVTSALAKARKSDKGKSSTDADGSQIDGPPGA